MDPQRSESALPPVQSAASEAVRRLHDRARAAQRRASAARAELEQLRLDAELRRSGKRRPGDDESEATPQVP